MTRSDNISALAAALAKAQARIEGAAKGKVNPHFKSAYADLASVWDACREPLASNGLSIVQAPSATGPTVTVSTVLLHDSGEWIASELAMTAGQDTPQGIGSCITYARRYALAAMVGIAPEDYDGNAASTPSSERRAKATVPAGYQDWLDDLAATADNGREALKAAWDASSIIKRAHLVSTANETWESIKAKAAKVSA